MASPTHSSLDHEKHGPHLGTSPTESIIPDGVGHKGVARHVDDEFEGDSSLNVAISDRALSWQRAAVLL